MKIWKAFHLGVGFLKVLASEWRDKHARFQHENLWSCAISSDSTKYWLGNSKTHIIYSRTLCANSALTIMARRLLQLFFSFFVTAEIEENCNMQLQVAKPENANQQKNGNSDLPGYDAIVGTMCKTTRVYKDFDGPGECGALCICSFYVALDVPQELCGCCKYPLDILPGQPDSVTLYEKRGCTWEVATPNATTEAHDAPPRAT